FGDELHAARNHQDSDLTPDGLDKRRQALADSVRGKYRRSIDEQREAVTLAEATDARRFAKHRPSIDWSNPASAARAQAKWEGVKVRLEAGIGVSDVIAHADAETLAALREYFPAYAEAHAPDTRAAGEPYSPPDLTGFHLVPDERAAVLGGAGAASAHAAWRQSAELAAWAGPTLDQYAATADGRSNHPIDTLTALTARAAANRERATGHQVDLMGADQ